MREISDMDVTLKANRSRYRIAKRETKHKQSAHRSLVQVVSATQSGPIKTNAQHATPSLACSCGSLQQQAAGGR